MITLNVFCYFALKLFEIMKYIAHLKSISKTVIRFPCFSTHCVLQDVPALRYEYVSNHVCSRATFLLPPTPEEQKSYCEHFH